MESTCKTAVAAAVAGGYVLGRTKKAKLALGLVMFVAGKRLKLSPADLAAAGMRQISDNPQLAGLRDQVRDELLTAVKSAASSTVDRRVSSLTDTLRDRTGALSGLGDLAEGIDEDGHDEHEDDEAHAEDEEPEEDESEEEGEEEDEEEEPEASKPHAAHGRRTTRSGGTSARARQAPKKEPAKRTPAKRAAPKSASKKAAPQRQSSSSGSGSGRAKSGSAGRSGSGRQGR